MVKDKNGSTRYDYNLKILGKEREMEELKLEEKSVQKAIEDFESTMNRHFQQIQAIEVNLKARSHSQDTYTETEQKRNYISRMLAQQGEELEKRYQQQQQALEDECIQLQKERDELPWD